MTTIYGGSTHNMHCIVLVQCTALHCTMLRQYTENVTMHYTTFHYVFNAAQVQTKTVQCHN